MFDGIIGRLLYMLAMLIVKSVTNIQSSQAFLGSTDFNVVSLLIPNMIVVDMLLFY